MPLLLLALLSACDGDVLPPLAPPAVDAEAIVLKKQVGTGENIEMELRLWQSPGWSLATPGLSAEGLNAKVGEPESPVTVGNRQLQVEHIRFDGPDGSYVIQFPPIKATGPGGQSRDIELSPVFVDIGVPGPKGGDMADFEGAPPPQPPPWGLIVGASAGLLIVGGGLAFLWWRHKNRPVPIPIPDPPALIAERAWAAARAAGLDDHSLALTLSRIFRAYLEAVSTWPATARTTREILVYLEANSLLDLSHRLRAAQLLDATDRLKFAREGGGQRFFEEMDEDFAAVIEATRPLPMSPAGPSVPPSPTRDGEVPRA